MPRVFVQRLVAVLSFATVARLICNQWCASGKVAAHFSSRQPFREKGEHTSTLEIFHPIVAIFEPNKNDRREVSTRSRSVDAMSTNRAFEDDDKIPGYRMRPNYEEGCRFRHSWQDESHPMCNNAHELDMYTGFRREEATYLGNGARRIAWGVHDAEGMHLALKTLVFGKRSAERLYVTNTEAQVASRLSSSKHAVHFYGHCGTAGIHEFAYAPFPRVFERSVDKLHAARQVAEAVAALHGIEDDGIPSMIYGHLQPDNVMIVNGTCKFSDFEKANFLKWNDEEQRICGFYRAPAGGENRAPEESSRFYDTADYPYRLITDASDVYRMGLIFYRLLTTRSPHRDTCDMAAVDVKHESSQGGLVGDILLESFQMTNACKPEARKSASEIATFLQQGIDRVINKEIERA